MTLWLIDAGHGGMLTDEYQTRGKRSPEIGVGVGVHEGEFTRDLMSRIIWRATFAGLNTAPLVGGSRDYSLKDRVQTAEHYIDEYGPDCALLSIHANASGYGPWRTARGTVVWYRRETSLQLARTMRTQMEPYLGDLISDRRGIKKGVLGILKPKIPAVLYECGFMTSKLDAALLASEKYRELLSRGFVDTMLAYERGGFE